MIVLLGLEEGTLRGIAEAEPACLDLLVELARERIRRLEEDRLHACKSHKCTRCGRSSRAVLGSHKEKSLLPDADLCVDCLDDLERLISWTKSHNMGELVVAKDPVDVMRKIARDWHDGK